MGMRSLGVLKAAVGLVLAMMTIFALAGECQVGTGYFVDPTGKLPADKAFSHKYQSFQGVLSHGYTDAIVWIRVDISNCKLAKLAEIGDWVVRIRPTYFDLIELFISNKNDNQPISSTGDTTAMVVGSYRSINLGFQMPAAELSKPFFLRARTQSSNMLKVEVMTKAQAESMDLKQAYLNGLILTLLMLFVIWAFLQLALDRDQFSLVFAWQQTIVLLHGLFILGYGRYFLSDTLGGRFVDFTTSALVLLYIGSRLLIEFFLFLQIRPPKVYVRYFYFLALAWLTGPFIFFFYSERIGLMLNLSIGMIGIVSCLVLTVLTPEQSKGASDIILPKKVLVAYFALMCFLSAVFALPMLGLAHGIDWIVDFPTILGVVSSSLIVLTLLIRRHYIEENAKRLATNLLLAQERASFEEEKRAEQAHMLAVLVHEVKNPLAVAKLNLGLARGSERSHARLGRAIDNIDAIVEQCGFSLQFEQELIKPVMKRCNVRQLIGDLLDELSYRHRFEVDVVASVEVETDDRLLRIIVTNLLDNANKYALPDTLIVIRLIRSAGGGMVLRVGNQIGLDQKVDPEKIFGKFYREQSTGSQSGSGLGLYICNNIAKALGMRLSVEISTGHIEFILCLLN